MQLYLDVPTGSEHTFQISMREDGTEINRWLLACDMNYRPEAVGPPAQLGAKRSPPRSVGVSISSE